MENQVCIALSQLKIFLKMWPFCIMHVAKLPSHSYYFIKLLSFRNNTKQWPLDVKITSFSNIIVIFFFAKQSLWTKIPFVTSAPALWLKFSILNSSFHNHLRKFPSFERGRELWGENFGRTRKIFKNFFRSAVFRHESVSVFTQVEMPILLLSFQFYPRKYVAAFWIDLA